MIILWLEQRFVFRYDALGNGLRVQWRAGKNAYARETEDDAGVQLADVAQPLGNRFHGFAGAAEDDEVGNGKFESDTRLVEVQDLVEREPFLHGFQRRVG
jgi:hypothetical protein